MPREIMKLYELRNSLIVFKTVCLLVQNEFRNYFFFSILMLLQQTIKCCNLQKKIKIHDPICAINTKICPQETMPYSHTYHISMFRACKIWVNIISPTMERKGIQISHHKDNIYLVSNRCDSIVTSLTLLLNRIRERCTDHKTISPTIIERQASEHNYSSHWLQCIFLVKVKLNLKICTVSNIK